MRLESSNNELGQEVLIAGVDDADLQRQSIYDKYTLVLWCTIALNARDKIIEARKRIDSFTKIIQDLKEACTDFFKIKIDFSCK